MTRPSKSIPPQSATIQIKSYTNEVVDFRLQSLFWNDFNEKVENYGWLSVRGGWEIYSKFPSRDYSPYLRHKPVGNEDGKLISDYLAIPANQDYQIVFWVRFPSSDGQLRVDLRKIGGDQRTLYEGTYSDPMGNHNLPVQECNRYGWCKIRIPTGVLAIGDYQLSLRAWGEVFLDDFSFGILPGRRGQSHLPEFSWSFSAVQNPHGITTDTGLQLIDRAFNPGHYDHDWQIHPNTYSWVTGDRRSQEPTVMFTRPGWYRIRLGVKFQHGESRAWVYRNKYVHVSAFNRTHRDLSQRSVNFYPNPIDGDGRLFICTEGFSGQEAKLSVPTEPNYIPVSFKIDDSDHEIDLSVLSSGQHVILLEIGAEKFFQTLIKL